MQFNIVCHDKPDHLALRLATRPTHLEYLKQHAASFIVVGPMLDAEGNPCGSLYVIDMPDEATAQTFVANDPYALAGLFADVTVKGFRMVFKDGAML
jgi:uncharacterized protein YciI